MEHQGADPLIRAFFCAQNCAQRGGYGPNRMTQRAEMLYHGGIIEGVSRHRRRSDVESCQSWTKEIWRLK